MHGWIPGHAQTDCLREVLCQSRTLMKSRDRDELIPALYTRVSNPSSPLYYLWFSPVSPHNNRAPNPLKCCQSPHKFQYITQETTAQQLQKICSSAQPLLSTCILSLRWFLANHLLSTRHHQSVEALHHRKERSEDSWMITLSNISSS